MGIDFTHSLADFLLRFSGSFSLNEWVIQCVLSIWFHLERCWKWEFATFFHHQAPGCTQQLGEERQYESRYTPGNRCSWRIDPEWRCISYWNWLNFHCYVSLLEGMFFCPDVFGVELLCGIHCANDPAYLKVRTQFAWRRCSWFWRCDSFYLQNRPFQIRPM